MRLCPEAVEASGPWLPWSAAPCPELAASVASCGILHPVLVDASGQRPLLVDGYGRLELARAAGSDVLALDLGPLTPAQRLAHHLAANLHKPRTDARLAAACRAALELGLSLDAALAMLQLHPKTKTARLLAAWMRLPPAWDRFLAAGHACLAVAEALARLAPTDLAALMPVVAAYAWSQGALGNLLTWLTEAARREGVPLAMLVAGLGLDAVQKLSPQDAMARLLEAARRRRYPELTGLEDRWHEAARAVGLPAPWRLVRPDQFETGAVELRLRVSRPEDVAAAAAALAGCAQAPAWRDLLEVGA